MFYKCWRIRFYDPVCFRIQKAQCKALALAAGVFWSSTARDDATLLAGLWQMNYVVCVRYSLLTLITVHCRLAPLARLVFVKLHLFFDPWIGLSCSPIGLWLCRQFSHGSHHEYGYGCAAWTFICDKPEALWQQRHWYSCFGYHVVDVRYVSVFAYICETYFRFWDKKLKSWLALWRVF